MKLVILLVAIWIWIFGIDVSDSARILGISWYPSPSHEATFQPIWKELSLRGHQVTIITSAPLRDQTLNNLTEIDVSFLSELCKKKNLAKVYSRDQWIWNLAVNTRYFLQELVEAMLQSEEVNALINSDEKFDVVIAEPHSPLVFAFGVRFNAPVIGK